MAKSRFRRSEKIQMVNKINKNLAEEGLWQKGLVELPAKTRRTQLDLIKQNLEFNLLTARNFYNPEYLLPGNPVKRFIKKKLLSFFKFYTGSQIVFNKNIIEAIENLYQYLNILEKKRKK